MFVGRLERVGTEYIVTIPADVIRQQDLHDGQTVSIHIQPLDDFVSLDVSSDESTEQSWKLNEVPTTYRPERRRTTDDNNRS